MPASPHRSDTIVVMGVSGVGKTTVADGIVAATGWDFAEGDDFHPEANVAKMRAGTPLDDEDRWPWLRALAAWIGEQEQRGRSSVVACSALKRSYRDLLSEGNPSVRFCALEAGNGKLQERVDHREGHFMPPALLRSQLDTYEPLGPDEPGARVNADGSEASVIARVLDALDLPAAAGGGASPGVGDPTR
ncbi:MAG: gluconokinase [Geodermatophilaceae bacterium]